MKGSSRSKGGDSFTWTTFVFIKERSGVHLYLLLAPTSSSSFVHLDPNLQDNLRIHSTRLRTWLLSLVYCATPLEDKGRLRFGPEVTIDSIDFGLWGNFVLEVKVSGAFTLENLYSESDEARYYHGGVIICDKQVDFVRGPSGELGGSIICLLSLRE